MEKKVMFANAFQISKSGDEFIIRFISRSPVLDKTILENGGEGQTQNLPWEVLDESVVYLTKNGLNSFIGALTDVKDK
ncbi:MAG: hypothetical protein AB9907_05580 [Flexilinea sp.]